MFKEETKKVFINANGDRDWHTKAQIPFEDYVSRKSSFDSLTEKINKRFRKHWLGRSGG